MSARKKVVTYQSTRGAQVNICPTCKRKLKENKVWPHDHAGEECCTVSHGLHFAICAFCVDDHGEGGFEAALQEQNCW